jgi:hypothetical protein
MRLFVITVAFKRFRSADRFYFTEAHVVMAADRDDAVKTMLATQDPDLIYAYQVEDLGADRSWKTAAGRTTRADIREGAGGAWTVLDTTDLQPQREPFRLSDPKPE